MRDLEKFRQSPSGTIVKAGPSQASYWAFIPNPLPPDLSMNLTIGRQLADAAQGLGELAGLGRTVPNPQLLIRPFIRREAVLSSRIEGTQTGLADLMAYEANQQPLPEFGPLPAQEDIQEVLNYVEALEYGIERLSTLPVSTRFLCELHARLMAGVRGEHATPGEFRRSQNWIGRPGSTLNTATFVPPAPENMQEALGKLEHYFHEENHYPALIRLAFIHYQFEAIHPFLDGNGRIGRLLIILLMIDWGMLPAPLLYLSAYFEQHRWHYYDLLLRVSMEGAWEEWVEFFLHGITEQAKDANQRAHQILDLQSQWQNILRTKNGSPLMLSIADLLFQKPLLSAAEVTKEFDVVHSTAMRALTKLVALNILEELSPKGRRRQFVARNILNLNL